MIGGALMSSVEMKGVPDLVQKPVITRWTPESTEGNRRIEGVIQAKNSIVV